ncbi:MAG TPA: membrane dipeptidase [Thermoanaerobaculia bacterium]
MNRRQLLRTGLLGGLGLVGSPMINLGRCRLAAQPAGIEVPTAAVDLVLGSTVVDMLGLLTLDWPKLFRWQRSPRTFVENDFRKLEASGVNVFHPAVETSSSNAHDAIRRWINNWRALLDAHPCYFSHVTTVSDLVVAPKVGKIGVLIGFQNSDHFRTLNDVEVFHRLGQRVSQLTYNERNRLGDGCYVRRDRGLTAFGAQVVAEMNRLGMVVDVSHCGERTSLDAVEVSQKPVLITHSNCKALVPGHPRCKSDRVIRRMAAGGGVMGITIVRGFVSRKGSPTVEDLLDHFDHVARLVGPEYVGLGSDADVDILDPRTGRERSIYHIRGMEPAVRVYQIAAGLLRRGYSRDDVELVIGGNFRRALLNVWLDATSWPVVPERLTRRDPFCPARIPARPFFAG